MLGRQTPQMAGLAPSGPSDTQGSFMSDPCVFLHQISLDLAMDDRRSKIAVA